MDEMSMPKEVGMMMSYQRSRLNRRSGWGAKQAMPIWENDFEASVLISSGSSDMLCNIITKTSCADTLNLFCHHKLQQ
jgi:hypothetical protein